MSITPDLKALRAALAETIPFATASQEGPLDANSVGTDDDDEVPNRMGVSFDPVEAHYQVSILNL